MAQGLATLEDDAGAGMDGTHRGFHPNGTRPSKDGPLDLSSLPVQGLGMAVPLNSSG